MERNLTELEKESLDDLRYGTEDYPGNDELADAMYSLLMKGHVRTFRGESGEFYWQLTSEGKTFAEMLFSVDN